MSYNKIKVGLYSLHWSTKGDVETEISIADKQVTVLIGLDLSAAFDTVDHRLLLDRLQLEIGVTEIPLRWLQSYLEGRTQFIKMGQHKSHATEAPLSGTPDHGILLSILSHTLLFLREFHPEKLSVTCPEVRSSWTSNVSF